MNRRSSLARLLSLFISPALFSCGCKPTVSNPVGSVPASPVDDHPKEINPRKAVADLLTARREQAFEDLQSWWKSHQPEVYSSTPRKIRRVECYQRPDKSSITVVFTGEPTSQYGNIYLINSDGRQTPIYQGNSFTDGDDLLVDVNGDKLPELVGVHDVAGYEYKNGEAVRVVTLATGLDIIPITPEQIPLLRVVFDVRSFKAMPTWRWRFVETTDGFSDVLVEQQQQDGWTEKVRFVWSTERSKYEGPAGSDSDGFIASAGDLEKERINQFLKKS